MIYVILADGFEEVEAIAPIDVMRRANIDVKLAGVGGTQITGSHSIPVTADIKVDDIDTSDLDGIILPGGMPGTINLKQSECVNKLIKHCYENGLLIAAICAAPSILGELGLLSGREAVCFPGYEAQLSGADIYDCSVAVSDNIITAKGAGASLEFGAAIVDYLLSEDGVGKTILTQMQYPF